MFFANHPFAKRELNVLDMDGNEGCAHCGRPRAIHPAPVECPGRLALRGVSCGCRGLNASHYPRPGV
jgi:CRISPR/Cas system-associated protein Cas10 (large subunit of type III CRISPR-Cas system)